MFVYLVNLSMSYVSCACQEYLVTIPSLALLENEQKFKLGGVLALIKCIFHEPTYRVLQEITMLKPFATNKVPHVLVNI